MHMQIFQYPVMDVSKKKILYSIELILNFCNKKFTSWRKFSYQAWGHRQDIRDP